MANKRVRKRTIKNSAGALLLIGAMVNAAQGAPPAEQCASADEHQWDFWLGKWRVTDPSGAFQGMNTIRRGPQGCGLVEHWTGAQGNEGMSLNGYDSVRKTWTQFWVSPGIVIRLEGRLERGALRMQGSISYNKTGVLHPFRGIWTPQPDGSVKQEFFEQEGKVWKTWFSGIYRRTA